MYLQAPILLALACGALAKPLNARKVYTVKDNHNVPRGWRKAGRAPEGHTLNLKIGLKQSRFDELHQSLYEVSDPAHARYGQHLSAAEVERLVRPSDEALESVHAWLADHGIDTSNLDYSPAKDWITVPLPVDSVETLLDTEYNSYVHDDGDMLIRAPKWGLPAHLHEHIESIQPTSSFFRPQRQSRVKTLGESFPIDHIPSVNGTSVADVCDATLVTPLCLRTLYGTVNYKVQSAGKNYMALNDFLGEVNNRSDVEIYMQKFRPEAVGAAYQFSQISIANGTLQQTPDNATQLVDETGVEGNLDAQTMLGIAWPVPLVTYSTGGVNPDYQEDLYTGATDSDEPYLVWLQYILSLPDSALPSVISTSYGDDEQTIPFSYASPACNMFAQLGARGVTVLFSSGDEGVGADDYCYSNDGTNSSTFLPAFPASCPYVTSVGATTNFTPEVAAYDPRFSTPFTSGGGFSNYFSRPDYQSAVVSEYLTKYVGTNYTGLYNTTGRGYPDVAAQGQNFSTVWNGFVIPVDGTSAASPTMGGVIALVNDALIAAGKSPLGFMNPWLYGGGYKAFHDITSGSSAGCNTDGFPAEVGWDAVTGWGSPYFPDIIKALGVDGCNSTQYTSPHTPPKVRAV